MSSLTLILIVAAIAAAGFIAARARAQSLAVSGSTLHSRPVNHGAMGFVLAALPAFLVLCLWLVAEGPIGTAAIEAGLSAAEQELPDAERGLLVERIRNIAAGIETGEVSSEAHRAAAAAYVDALAASRLWMSIIVIALSVAGAFIGMTRVSAERRARNEAERVARAIMLVASLVAILTTIGIFMSLIFESVRFFGKVPLTDFLFGLEWSPQTAIRADQVGSSGAFGAVPLFLGTTLIMLIAMVVAVPVGLFAAIYLSEYAGPRTRAVVKPLLEVLAGIPTVVYGFFAALTVAPFLREIGASIGLDVASESALAAGAVMGIMIVPFISSLSDDVINAVPQTLRDGSYAMGATKSETIRKVVLPAALPGIVGAVLLAVSRAIGETMIVVMAAGLAGNLTFNPLDAVTTVTVQIKTLLVGDQEFDSAKTLSAFALGLVLFLVTLVLNIIALRTVQKYREKYD